MMNERDNLLYDMDENPIGAWDGERIEELRTFLMMSPGVVYFSALPHDDQIPDSII